jgi:prevent-host-death family protein
LRREVPVNTKTVSSREFNQDVSGVKKASADGPIFITDRGRPAHVLLTIEEYRRITGKKASLIDMLSMPGIGDIDFDPPRMDGDFYRPADFSDSE